MVRGIFDVALGYDACKKVDYNDGSEVWAVYNKSKLAIEKQPIVTLNEHDKDRER